MCCVVCCVFRVCFFVFVLIIFSNLMCFNSSFMCYWCCALCVLFLLCVHALFSSSYLSFPHVLSIDRVCDVCCLSCCFILAFVSIYIKWKTHMLSFSCFCVLFCFSWSCLVYVFVYTCSFSLFGFVRLLVFVSCVFCCCSLLLAFSRLYSYACLRCLFLFLVFMFVCFVFVFGRCPFLVINI